MASDSDQTLDIEQDSARTSPKASRPSSVISVPSSRRCLFTGARLSTSRSLRRSHALIVALGFLTVLSKSPSYMYCTTDLQRASLFASTRSLMFRVPVVCCCSCRICCRVRVLLIPSAAVVVRSGWISTLLPSSVIDVQNVGSMTYLIFFSKHSDCILFFALVLSQQFSPSVIMANIALTICFDHKVFRFHFVVCLRIVSIFVHNLLSTLKFCWMNCLFQQTLRSILLRLRIICYQQLQMCLWYVIFFSKYCIASTP